MESSLSRGARRAPPPGAARPQRRRDASALVEPNLPVDRPAQLLQQLEALFLAEGFSAFTVSELAARLRCSKRALYELAPSKEELFLLVLKRCLDDIWQRGIDAERSVTDLRLRIRWYVESALVPLRQWSPAFLADIAAVDQARHLLDRHLVDRMARLEDMVRAGTRSGLFRKVHPQLVAEMIHVTAARCCQPDFLAASRLSLEGAIEQMCSVLWDGLLRPE